MRIVLLGDIHLYQLRVWPWQLASKRVIGQMNLWFNRRFHFRIDRLGAMVERATAVLPDAVLLSGDLTTTALPGEFAAAMALLDPLVKSVPTWAVPGNHDRYTFTAARRRVFERYLGEHTTRDWPLHRRLAPGLHLVGLDPTRPNIVSDRGRLPAPQLDKLRGILDELAPTDRLIVLCHYTLGTPPGYHHEAPRHRMTNAAELLDILRGDRPTLYLHGHQHEPWCWRITSAPNIVAVNAGAPVLVKPHWPGGQGFWQIDTDPASDGEDWRLIHHHASPTGEWSAAPVSLPKPGEASPIQSAAFGIH